eukprot:TRINITY_DN2117_c1_g1_i1.p1 TRINITY_DN2117_c1_g1~~TRINITY_DN2117_c1_g1_i1.p1  ORF type:complete len:228 (+),score=31.55 TRINITY_DN2117_c1_g1_i1:60-743(+)
MATMSSDERLARSLQAGEYIRARQQAHRHHHHPQRQGGGSRGEQQRRESDIDRAHRHNERMQQRAQEVERMNRRARGGGHQHGHHPLAGLERVLLMMPNMQLQQQHHHQHQHNHPHRHNNHHHPHRVLMIPLAQMLRGGVLRRRRPRGANSEQIEDNSGKFVLQDKEKLTDENKSCTVCLMEFDNGEELRALPCLHLFHPECVDRWLQQNPKCPTCRADLVGQPAAS